MIRAYLDRNVWQDLYDRVPGIAASTVERLRSAVRHGEIDVAVSVVCLEETYARHTSEPSRAIAEMRFILETAGTKDPRRTRLIKEPGQYMDDEIRAYAAGSPEPDPFMIHDMSPLLYFRTTDHRLVEEFAKETRHRKQEFYDFMNRQRRTLAHKSESRSGGIRLAADARRSFDEYFEANTVEFARGLAERAAAISAVEVRGVHGLLDLRSVRMAVGSNLSLTYSQIFENRAPRQGDWGDLFHAIAAAVADVFVTKDGRLAACLRRIPALPVEVIDLQTLFIRLERRA